MKLRVTPILEEPRYKADAAAAAAAAVSGSTGAGGQSDAFVIDRNALEPKVFVDLMDQYKALLFQRAAPDATAADTPDAAAAAADAAATATAANDAAVKEVLSVEDFGHFLVDLQLEYYPYIGGAAPRRIIPVTAGTDIVFTANERYVHVHDIRMCIYIQNVKRSSVCVRCFV